MCRLANDPPSYKGSHFLCHKAEETPNQWKDRFRVDFSRTLAQGEKKVTKKRTPKGTEKKKAENHKATLEKESDDVYGLSCKKNMERKPVSKHPN
jgi:hypothetical protein